ncbi:hypothetical protein B0H11DRAFT_2088858 [Mycena galericulata]|nr:hypothetical protein B0H11DRAFT_2088858 [Mycena galericulata]
MFFSAAAAAAVMLLPKPAADQGVAKAPWLGFGALPLLFGAESSNTAASGDDGSLGLFFFPLPCSPTRSCN